VDHQDRDVNEQRDGQRGPCGARLTLVPERGVPDSRVLAVHVHADHSLRPLHATCLAIPYVPTASIVPPVSAGGAAKALES